MKCKYGYHKTVAGICSICGETEAEMLGRDTPQNKLADEFLPCPANKHEGWYDEMGWLIEHPESATSAPMYLARMNNTFGWYDCHTHALRFARKKDADDIAAISKALLPELWEKREYVGLPRVCLHEWAAKEQL